ncbi:MAG TPA: DUF4956 domain-containing protein [Urbifossiella sp.]|jgi:hypothetical protein
MPEFFEALIPSQAELPTAQLAARLVQAACLGVVVAAVYYLTQRKSRAEAVPFVATLVLLCVLIAMVTQVIGSNLARAFSLAGALAIIRFRTVVDDTRDTAFVIAAVVTGMAVGSESMAVALAGVPVVAVIAWALRFWARPLASSQQAGVPREPSSLVIRIGIGSNAEKTLADALARHLESQQLLAAATARQGAALDLTYSVLLKPSATAVALIADLNKVEGVQGAEWKNN